MINSERGQDAARVIATHTLGREAGPMTLVASGSHHVYAGLDVVVKLIAAAEHSRLDREIILARDLPAGLSALLLGSGAYSFDWGDVRYACYRRVAGGAPGIGMPGVDGATARRWAGEAVDRLSALHAWRPNGRAAQILSEPLDHGGFVGRAALLAAVAKLIDEDRSGLVDRHVLDRLAVIAAQAPLEAKTETVVHADCHWGNWLVGDDGVVALLDFEWARFGEPIDDWFFLARFSGTHQQIVLGVIADVTSNSRDDLRAECEVREASYLMADLVVALQSPDRDAHVAGRILNDLEDVVVNRSWWAAK
jgi:Phosphotransferase enzyme family